MSERFLYRIGGGFTFFSHGVRLSPLGTAAIVWPVVPAPDDR
jgi:hypothetical protein